MKEGYVTAETGLNLRRTPQVTTNNRVAVLPNGQRLRLSGTILNSFAEATTTLNGRDINGWVSTAYIETLPLTQDAATSLKPIYLQPKPGVEISRQRGGRAFMLNEPNIPGRNDRASVAVKTDQIHSIINFLDVENSPRYKRNPKQTFCNIYAADFCYLAGAYLPRVWWEWMAFAKISKGENQPIVYGETVYEQTANMLNLWLKGVGQQFNWQRVFDLEELQDAANLGHVAVIVGENINPHRPGHITIVAPETTEHRATRESGKVTKPLQSQAGSKNKKYGVGNWWESSTYRECTFWIHQ